VYSTCSLEPEENQEVAQQFLAAHDDYVQVGDRRLLPFKDRTDGAYVAVLERRKATAAN
jgi:16S rRNA (cytosine967-C5)-methyltransferase